MMHVGDIVEFVERAVGPRHPFVKFLRRRAISEEYERVKAAFIDRLAESDHRVS